MSTKNRFIRAFNECPRDSVLSNLMNRLQRKQNTQLTEELLENNGWINVGDKGDDYYKLYETVVVDDGYDIADELKEVELPKWFLYLFNKTDRIKTVADLEDALDLCGIDVEIKI